MTCSTGSGTVTIRYAPSPAVATAGLRPPFSYDAPFAQRIHDPRFTPASSRGNIDSIGRRRSRGASHAGERLVSGLLAAVAVARRGHGPVRALPALQGRLHRPEPGCEANPQGGGPGRPPAAGPGGRRRHAARGAARLPRPAAPSRPRTRGPRRPPSRAPAGRFPTDSARLSARSSNLAPARISAHRELSPSPAARRAAKPFAL